MKRNQSTIIALILFLGIVAFGCKKSKTAPVSERIAKAWTAANVKEGTAVVYVKGGTSNKRDYTAFQLTLNSSGTVVYKDWDGVVFNGQWEISNDKLVLKNLNPAPTGTNGTIEFDINTLGDNQLVITRTTGSVKTGNSINQYTLQNP
jgi:hypothetical protein